MLSNAPFYFSLIKKYVALFGATFDNIYITRTLLPDYTPDPTKSQLIKVPISYANKDKLLARLAQDPDLDRPFSLLLPTMSFELLDMKYDPTRKQVTNNYNAKLQPDGAIWQQYVGVPYDLQFALYIAAKNTEDATQIVEQILPFFTPDWTSSVELIPEMGITQNIPIIRNTLSMSDTYDGQFQVRRQMIWTLGFILKGWLYGPILKPGIIKDVKVQFRIADNVADGQLPYAVGVTPLSEELDVQVTLTAQGTPTTDHTQSIPFHFIQITQDYGFAHYVTNFASDNPVVTGPKDDHEGNEST
jgi:hypothetical protein